MKGFGGKGGKDQGEGQTGDTTWRFLKHQKFERLGMKNGIGGGNPPLRRSGWSLRERRGEMTMAKVWIRRASPQASDFRTSCWRILRSFTAVVI